MKRPENNAFHVQDKRVLSRKAARRHSEMLYSEKE